MATSLPYGQGNWPTDAIVGENLLTKQGALGNRAPVRSRARLELSLSVMEGYMASTQDSYVRPEELPELYRLAGRAALRARRIHGILLRLAYASLVAAAFLSSGAPFVEAYRSGLDLLGATLMAVALLSIVASSLGGFARSGYGARILAESVRSLSWRYMAKAAPFQPGVSAHEVDNRFMASLRVILNSREALRVLSGLEVSDGEITERMRQIRALPATARSSTYFQARIARQRSIHAALAAGCRRQNLLLAVIAILATIAGLAIGLLSALQGDLPVQLLPAFAALCAAVLGWSSHRRGQQLVLAHKLAEYELGLIASRKDFVHNDGDLSRLATNAESALSKEHTMWAARRVTM